MMKAAAMPDHQRAGEARERARARRWTIAMAALFVVGLATGFGYAMAEDDATGRVPLWVAIAACVAYLGSVLLGIRSLKRASDEVERAHNHSSMAIAALAYLIVYPCWYLLWRGGLLPEPSHEYLFVGVYFTMLTAYLWKKYR